MSSFEIPSSFSVFFWFAFFTLILFQGAVHTCILLILKAWKYKNLGRYWEKVIWINFFWIGIFLWISSWVYEWGHRFLFDHLWLGITLTLHFSFSGWCLIRSAYWAAHAD